MTKDYLAIIRIGGGSTYGRDASIFDAVEGAARILVLDCHRYYQLPNMHIGVTVYDVTGHGEISWGDAFPVKSQPDGELIEPLKTVEVEMPPLTGRAKITGPKYLAELERAVARACSFEPDPVMSVEVDHLRQLVAQQASLSSHKSNW